MPLKTATRKLFVRIRNDFNLDSAKPHQFYRSEWELIGLEEDLEHNAAPKNIPPVSLKFLIYRGIYMIIFVTSLTYSTTCQSHLYSIFLTNWSFTAQNLYSILFFLHILWRWFTINKKSRDNNSDVELGAGVVNKSSHQIVAKTNSVDSSGQLVLSTNDGRDEEFQCQSQSSYQKPEEDGENCCEKTSSLQRNRPEVIFGKRTFLEKAIHCLINIVHVLPFLVVLGYWCVVYKYDPDQPPCEKFRSHYIVHGATAVLAFIDALVIAVPARITHFLIPTGLVLIYVIFTFFYEVAGGEYRQGKLFIYSILDWKNNALRALIASTLGILIATPLAHTVFCWGIYKLRMWLISVYKRYNKK